jgi:hypothetical protein
MKGLSLEQIDRMLEETTPRKSAKWKPHSTFAGDLNLVAEKIEVPIMTETARANSVAAGV